jgi:molybdenum cofactor cytidylyltransferase
MIQLAVMDTEPRATSKVAGIVLAAGGSARMGRAKQLLPIDGQPMVRRITSAAHTAGLDQVVVVVGAHAQMVQQALAGLPVDVVHNQAWAEGMSTSLAAGLRALRPEMQATIIILADQPALAPGLIRELVGRYRESEALIVAPYYEEQRGNPVLFDRVLFPELLEIQGDRGGREVVGRHQDQVERIEIDDPAVTLDVDTKHDYERIGETEHGRRQ